MSWSRRPAGHAAELVTPTSWWVTTTSGRPPVPEPTPEAVRRFAPWHPAEPDPLDRRAPATTIHMGWVGLVCSVVDGGMRGDFTLHTGHRDPPATAVLTAVCDATMGALVTSAFGMPARTDDLHVAHTGHRASGSHHHCLARVLLTPGGLVAAAAEVRDDEDRVVARARAGYRLC